MATDRERSTSAHRASAGIFVLLAGLFLWTSMLTFSPLDWPSPKITPHPWPPHNACGRAGAMLAYQLFYYFGEGAYPLSFGATAAAVVWLIRGGISLFWQRAFGSALIVALTACIYRLLWPGDVHSLPEGNGGVLGIALANFLTHNFSTWGTVLVLGYAAFVGVAFVTEGLVRVNPQTMSRSVRSASALGVEWARTRPWARLAGAVTTVGTSIRSGSSAEAAVMDASVEDETINVRARIKNAGSDHSRARGRSTAEKSPDSPATTESPTPKRAKSEGPVTPPAKPSQTADDASEPDTSPAEPRVKAHGLRPAVQTSPPEPYPKELGDWELPSQDLLEEPEYLLSAHHERVVREKAHVLERTLKDFRIEAKVVEIDTGPVITLYELSLAAGIKVSQVVALSNDVARALKAPAVRVVAPIPGKNTVGIEVPNLEKEKVRLQELMTVSGQKPLRMHLPLFIGKDASGNPLVTDLAAMPHLLIAGTTGSGKSVCINSIIMSLLMTQRPDMVKLIMVDPKMVELSLFKTVPHLMAPIITEVPRAEMVLDWAVTKMDERYELLAEAGVRNISAYNRLGRDELMARFQPTTDDERAQIPVQMPYVVIIIDELADLMMQSGKTVELQLSRLAQKSRAVGIHIVVATQRPEAKVVTGLIKSNLPCRIAFRVSSRLDSRIVLDQNGAEVLMGQGDMLFLPPGSAKLMRAQGTFIEDSELKSVIEDLADKGEPEFHPELMKIRSDGGDGGGPRDELFDEAVRIVLETGRGSVSLLQRRLMIGYSRASRLIDQMADAGVVGAYKGSQAREVVMTLEDWEKRAQAPQVDPVLPVEEFPAEPRFRDDADADTAEVETDESATQDAAYEDEDDAEYDESENDDQADNDEVEGEYETDEYDEDEEEYEDDEEAEGYEDDVATATEEEPSK